MDIHKPKPWHGVREFLKEYVIIVVGVLTALGAEQGVEWLHWQHEVHVADEALRNELHFNGANAYRYVVSWPCEQKRLDELSAALRRKTGLWKGQSFDYNGRRVAFIAPGRGWPRASWEEYKANGAVQHMSDARRRLFGGAYVHVDSAIDWNRDLSLAIADLAILADDLPLTDVTRDRELAAVERAQFAGELESASGKQFLEKLTQLGVTFTEAEMHPDSAACRAAYGPGRPIGG